MVAGLAAKATSNNHGSAPAEMVRGQDRPRSSGKAAKPPRSATVTSRLPPHTMPGAFLQRRKPYKQWTEWTSWTEWTKSQAGVPSRSAPPGPKAAAFLYSLTDCGEWDTFCVLFRGEVHPPEEVAIRC